MFVFHQQMNFVTFLVCIWLWAALLSSRGSAMPVALCQVLELLCRCDLKEMVLHIPAVSFHSRDVCLVRAGVFNLEFG